MSTTAQQVDALLAQKHLQRADRNNPPIPSQRKVKVRVTYLIEERILDNLPLYDLISANTPEPLKLIDVRVELL